MTTTVGIVESEWKFVGDGPQSRVSKSPLQLFLEAIVQSSTRGNIDGMTGNRFERCGTRTWTHACRISMQSKFSNMQSLPGGTNERERSTKCLQNCEILIIFNILLLSTNYL